MKRVTLLLIPENATEVRQMKIPLVVFRILLLGGMITFSAMGYFVLDYISLRATRDNFQHTLAENNHLKGEAQILIRNLDDVKKSLSRIHDYTSKLSELVSLKVKKVSDKTGIGPLSPEEYRSARANMKASAPLNHLPLGLNIDKLVFSPLFRELSSLGLRANSQAHEMQHLLSTLSQKKSLLSSVPSVSPVDGWTTSKFGFRISPFTGRKTMHRGIDIAAPVGTPIFAPADGVVIFSGAKAGFGNFVMIAHGYGIVSRYGHNAQNLVQVGQKVNRGDQIASVGTTGRTTGSHLHYEVWVNGRPVNPNKFILNNNLDFINL